MTTRQTTLVVVPGTGARSVAVRLGSTVAEFVCEHNLHGRDIIVDGVGVPTSSWNIQTLDTAREIFATGSVKGNTRQVTLVVVPGTGARSVAVDATMTVADLVSRENLHGRDIIVDGVGVPATNWSQTYVNTAREIFATGSVKGNVQSTATLVVVPGTGARRVSFDSESTVAEFVCANNLHGRDVILDGVGVPASSWNQTKLGSVREIFATGSVKGNGSQSFQELTFSYKNVIEAFDGLVQRAEWDHGHNPYSGTIATVQDFKFVETTRVFTEEEADTFAQERLKDMDKYDCEAIQVVNSTENRGFLFYGWAAC